MKTDKEIRTTIIEALKREHKISSPDAIDVSVNEGVATLKGYVDSYMDQATAEAVARSLPEISAVVQDLQVKLPPEKQRPDFDIARDACSAIQLNSSIPEESVKVVVDDGWVILEGEVDWLHQSEEVRSTVKRIGGIRGITNAISVREPITPADIWVRIEQAFLRAVRHHLRHIKVEIEDGKVILSGSVHAYFEKIEAEQVARQCPGIEEVINRLEIPPILEARVELEEKAQKK